MTMQEIQATLSELTSEDLQKLEGEIHKLYRQRKDPVIYDDAYGVWTEDDQASVADAALSILDAQENANG